MKGEWHLLLGKPKSRRYQIGFVPVPLSTAQWRLSLWFLEKFKAVTAGRAPQCVNSSSPVSGLTECSCHLARVVGATEVAVPPLPHTLEHGGITDPSLSLETV